MRAGNPPAPPSEPSPVAMRVVTEDGRSAEITTAELRAFVAALKAEAEARTQAADLAAIET